MLFTKIKVLALTIALIIICSCSQTSFCFCGCNGAKHLSILAESINQDRLASVHVNAPDPLHEINPPVLRLYIHWKLPKKYHDQNLTGILKIRFNDPHQIEVPFSINSLKGQFIHDILNHDYFDYGGVMAYKIEIFSNNQKIDVFEHKLWSELITIDGEIN